MTTSTRWLASACIAPSISSVLLTSTALIVTSAKALGLTTSESLLLRADDVIE
jgi:hypothetical protein